MHQNRPAANVNIFSTMKNAMNKCNLCPPYGALADPEQPYDLRHGAAFLISYALHLDPLRG